MENNFTTIDQDYTAPENLKTEVTGGIDFIRQSAQFVELFVDKFFNAATLLSSEITPQNSEELA